MPQTAVSTLLFSCMVQTVEHPELCACCVFNTPFDILQKGETLSHVYLELKACNLPRQKGLSCSNNRGKNCSYEKKMNKSIADPFDIATVFRDAASTMTCEHLEYFRPFTHDGTASKIPLCQVPDLVFDVLSRRWQRACSTQWLPVRLQLANSLDWLATS